MRLPTGIAVLVLAVIGCGAPEAPEESTDDDRIRAIEQPQHVDTGQESGRWWFAKPQIDEDSMPEEMIEELESIGYLSGTVEAGALSGVTKHDAEKAYPGYNLYCSGHAPEAVLMDMDGEVVHRWTMPFDEAFPDYDVRDDYMDKAFFRRVHLLPDGGLIAIFEGLGLVRIDKDSNLLWTFDGKAHHAAAIDPDGNVYTLARKGMFIDRVHEELPVLEDFIVKLDADGNEVQRISILEAFERSPYMDEAFRDLKKHVEAWRGDITHTNTIHYIGESVPAGEEPFTEGRLLLASLGISSVFVIDPATEEIVWFWKGGWKGLHEPTITPKGAMLLYENSGKDTVLGSRSIVYEYALPSRDVIWQYDGGENPALQIYSPTCGTVFRLPNGNTLITATDSGRAIEVTPDKEIVWEFYNPHRAGENDELIAALFHMYRLPADMDLSWAESTR